MLSQADIANIISGVFSLYVPSAPSTLDLLLMPKPFPGPGFRRAENYCANAGSSIMFSQDCTNSSDKISHLALVIYEYLITLRREAQLFWRGKWTGATVLFFFNRYLSLIVYICGFVGNAHISAQVRGILCIRNRVHFLSSLQSTASFIEVCPFSGFYILELGNKLPM